MKPQTPYNFTQINFKISQNTNKWSKEELKLLDEIGAEHSPKDQEQWTDEDFTKEEWEEELKIIKQIQLGEEPYDIGTIVVQVLMVIVAASLLVHAVQPYSLGNPVNCRRDQVFQVRRAHSDSQPPRQETVNRAARQYLGYGKTEEALRILRANSLGSRQVQYPVMVENIETQSLQLVNRSSNWSKYPTRREMQKYR